MDNRTGRRPACACRVEGPGRAQRPYPGAGRADAAGTAQVGLV